MMRAMPRRSRGSPALYSAIAHQGHYHSSSCWMQTQGNATFTQAVLNVINIVTGVGLLSVPFALRRAGWAGLGILWLMGFVMNYTGASPPPHAKMLYKSAVHALLTFMQISCASPASWLLSAIMPN